RDDEAAVLRAVDAAVLSTHGWGMSEEALQNIESAYARQGIVILTDPDHAGEEIRRRLSERFPEAKQAYLSRPDAEKRKDGRIADVGVENAAPEAIRDALLAAKVQVRETAPEDPVTPADLMSLGLAGSPQSNALRQAVGRELGIGSCNAKAFCRRLSAFGITREELLAAWRRNSPDNR
ncbi:MAG: DUF4093 domain-containing protein, partial [Firmicutes bacterium]|nr:DUF4093 domain-containing protein [Bacillota bacterium]